MAALILVTKSVAAQQTDSLRRSYMFEIPPVGAFKGQRLRTWPAMNLQTPSGYGARWGDWFVGVGFNGRVRFSSKPDGSFGGGFGLGDPRKYVGIEVDLASMSTVRQTPFKNSLWGFKIHRLFPGNVGIAVGWDDVMHTGISDAQSSKYMSGSKTFFRTYLPKTWFSSVTLSAGVGNGRFSLDTISALSSSEIFGSIGMRIAEPVSFIGEWNGQDITIGLSFAPFASLPLVITPAVTDITHRAGDGRRFIASAGLGFSFARRSP